MKKIIAAGLLICLLFTGCLSVYQVKAMAARAAEEEAANAYVPPSPTICTVDFDALYRSHDPEEVVCTVNDIPVSWEEYFYFYSSYALQIENTMEFLLPFKDKKNFKGIDLLPYHKMGVNKYGQLDMEYAITDEVKLEEEDLEFIRKFVLASGSLKEMAKEYEVSYPTIRLRLDKLIQLIQMGNDNKKDAYVSLIKKLALDEKIDFTTAKILISGYRDSLKRLDGEDTK